MKKITLIVLMLLISSTGLMAQTVSSGDITLSPDYTANIEVSPTTVTLTLIGLDDRWFALGFDATSMTPGQDVVIYDGVTITDRNFVGVGSTPPTDAASNDWTVTSDTSTAGMRTVVATRATSTGDPQDFDFSVISDGSSIDIVYAINSFASFDLGYHGGPPNRNAALATFSTLSTDDFNVGLDFSLSPNPAKDKFVVTLPSTVENARLEVFNVLGKRVLSKQISDIDSTVNVSNWNSGIYLVRISNGETSQTKRLVKQ